MYICTSVGNVQNMKPAQSEHRIYFTYIFCDSDSMIALLMLFLGVILNIYFIVILILNNLPWIYFTWSAAVFPAADPEGIRRPV